MATTQAGQTIIQSGENDANRDTLEDIYLAVNNTARLEKIGNNTYYLKDERIIDIRGFVDFSGQVLIVNGDDNNIRITTGGNFKCGTKLRDGVFKNEFTIIYPNGITLGQQQSGVSSPTTSFNSGGALLNINGLIVNDMASHAFGAFNLNDNTVDNIIYGLYLNIKESSYINITISSGTILSIESARNITIRDLSGVSFAIKSWNGGEDGSDIVKLLGSGIIEKLAIDYELPTSTVRIADSDFLDGTRTLKNSFVDISKLTGYGGVTAKILTTFTFKFSYGSTTLSDGNVYIKANSDNFVFSNNVLIANNSSLDIEQWSGRRIGTVGVYLPFTDNVVNRIDLLIGAIRYNNVIDIKPSVSDYLGAQNISFSMPQDSSIIEATKATVDAYTEIDNSAKFYDRAKSFLVGSFTGQTSTIVIRASETIDAGSYNITVDATAGTAFAFDGSTITIKASTFTGNLRTTGLVSKINGATIIGGIEDSNGNSYLKFESIESWKVFLIEPNRDANINETAVGTTGIYQFIYSPGTTYYLRVVSSGITFLIDSTPTAVGETIITLNQLALLKTMQSTMITNHDTIKIYAKKAGDNAEKANLKL